MDHRIEAVDRTGVLHVTLVLGAQGIKRLEFVLISDTLDEIHLDVSTIDLVGDIEQMHL